MEPTVTTGLGSTTNLLLRRVADGDQKSWGTLLTRHQARLRRMVAFRMDSRLQGRIDPADVIQEVYLAATKHLADYLGNPRCRSSCGSAALRGTSSWSCTGITWARR